MSKEIKKVKKSKKKTKKKEELVKTCVNCIRVKSIAHGKLRCYEHHGLLVTPNDFCDNFESK